MKAPRLVGAALVLVIVASAAIVAGVRRPVTSAATVPPDLRAPDSVRVRVQVLNGTKTRGLARRATQLLRDRGFDVVETGTESVPHDTTVVYDLTNHPDWARRVSRLFAPSRVETRPDSSRYLDVSVVLGATWRPPAQPFYP